MRFKFFRKNNGFSLMEVLLAAAIVAILAIITIPVINRQISKTDEYAYYMAYKTVEKMAGQIAAAGDPSEIPATTSFNNQNGIKFAKSKQNNSFIAYLNNKIKSNPMNKFATKLGEKFANTQAYILSKFVPKSYAAVIPVLGPNAKWSSADFDQLWLGYNVCSKGSDLVRAKITTTNEDGTTTTTTDMYTKEELGCDSSTPERTYDFEANVRSFLNYETLPFFVKSKFINEQEFLKMVKAVLDTPEENPRASLLCEDLGVTETPDQYVTTVYKEIEVDVDPSTFYSIYNSNPSETVTYGLRKYNTWVYYRKDSLEDYVEEECAPDDSECLAEESGDGTTVPELNENQTREDFNYESKFPGSCVMTSFYQITIEDIVETPFTPDRPTYDADWCNNNGYINMTNDGELLDSSDPSKGYVDINCKCSDGYVLSSNDSRVCVLPCSTNLGLPYTKYNNSGVPTGELVCCRTDFNPVTSMCCPNKSIYDNVDKECKCVSGYEMKDGACELVFCPKGYTKSEDGVCILNPPVIKADSFCKLIKDNWNTSEYFCNRDTVFTERDGYAVNESVYNAASSTSGSYLSTDSKVGAFNSITPNIVLSNGLKMWILGDKSASIPGISYYDDTITQTQNMCKKINLTTNTEAACKTAGGYFCGADNLCVAVSASSEVFPDSRNCCASPDFKTIQIAAEAEGKDWKLDPRTYAISGFTVFVDINGNRGNGTLWEDVYPFYISSNGTVYPGYPLDGVKSTGTNNSLYVGGNSEEQLPTDVYYFVENTSNNGREKKVAFAGVSYARAVCSARLVSKYTPYCLNLGEKFAGGDPLPDKELGSDGTTVKIDRSSSPDLVGRTDLTKKSYIEVDDEKSKNPCDKYRCFVAVRKKLKSF